MSGEGDRSTFLTTTVAPVAKPGVVAPDLATGPLVAEAETDDALRISLSRLEASNLFGD